ncbi:class I SAM-dependent methyltransferase [Tranquillimonas rosea]|uniref:class I SAM-dependent methyltransferase n=1 Tax=Tranquillimonas rosea TaxID=641238 RepID=UPI003BADACAB
MDAFFNLHDGLPREGPGDRESLDWALSRAAIPRDAAILDAGCGPGADIAGLLDHAPEGRVLALDTHAPFIAAVERGFGDDPRVTARCGDMLAANGPFDLIWCAGAIYGPGVEAALSAWAPQMRAGGTIAFSQLIWRVPEPPDAVRRTFAEVPGIGELTDLVAQVERAGWRVQAERVLPDAAWETYYRPLETRVQQKRLGASPELRDAIAATEAEIALWRRHRDSFGYAQIVAAAP